MGTLLIVAIIAVPAMILVLIVVDQLLTHRK
jgi:hypothetical protein